MPVVNLPIAHLARGVLKGKRKEATYLVLDRVSFDLPEIGSLGSETVLGYRASVTEDNFWMEVGPRSLDTCARVEMETDRLLASHYQDCRYVPAVTIPSFARTSKFEVLEIERGADWSSRFSRLASTDRDKRLVELSEAARHLAFVDGRLATSRLRPVGSSPGATLAGTIYPTTFRDRLSSRFVTVFERDQGLNADLRNYTHLEEVAGGGSLGRHLPGRVFDHGPFLGIQFLRDIDNLDWPADRMPLDADGVVALYRLRALWALEKRHLPLDVSLSEVREMVGFVVAGLDRDNLENDLMIDAFDRAFERFVERADELERSRLSDVDLDAIGVSMGL